MNITRETLLERFQLLNDEQLLSLFQSGDLIDLAKEVAAGELGQRGVEVAMLATEANMASKNPLGGEDNTPSGGVEAYVTDDHIVGTNSFLTMAVGGVRVLVPESDFEPAREIVRAIERGDYRLDDQSE